MGVLRRFPRFLSSVLLLGVTFSGLAALTQPAGSVKYGEENKPAAAPAAAAVANQIDMQVTHFGVGDRARPGDWAGIQVQLINRGANFPNVLVRMEMVDADGDIAQYSAAITANPGAKQSIWLYARLPYDVTDRQLVFSCYEAIEGSPGKGVAGVKPGKLLGRVVYAPRRTSERTSAGIALVGRTSMGLGLYGLHDQSTQHLHLGHGVSELVPLTPADLPDRWFGYAGFDTIVWGASGPEGEPTDLTESQAAAIREWVRRGGHFVVVLPAVGQTWLGTNNPLADIMPRVKAIREEGVNLNSYRRLLTGRNTVLPSSVVVHTFEPVAGAVVGEADQILIGPDGKCIVARRNAGVGAVSVIGIDLAGRTLAALDAIQPDIFWHRVLGRRGILWTPGEVAAAVRSNNLPPARTAAPLDTDIASIIDQKGASAIGVLLAFLVFVMYWVVAAPVGFFVLRQRGQSQHAWLGFVVAIGLFTAVAWGGATLIKPRKYEVSHVTLMDYVYGQNVMRARLFGSALLPTYGDVKLAVGNADDTRFNNGLAAWEPPESGGGSTHLYPDSRGYVVDARDPSWAIVPARSTVKSIQADWAGSTGEKWKMPLPVRAKDAPPEAPPVVSLRKLEIPVERRSYQAEGLIKNELPHSIENVMVIFVAGQNRPPAAVRGEVPEILRDKLPVDVFAAVLKGSWAPGATLDLGAIASDAQADTNPLGRFDDSLMTLGGTVRGGGQMGMGLADFVAKDFESRMQAAALYNILKTPKRGNQNTEPVFLRFTTQTWDLGRWFTQPCIIVLGFVREAPSPVPLTADGDALSTRGLTMIRWVYPLPAQPPSTAEPAAPGD